MEEEDENLSDAATEPLPDVIGLPPNSSEMA